MNIASIDIGTNTVLLLIAEADTKSKKIKAILNQQRIPRIGKGLKPGGQISDEKYVELISILKEYSVLIKSYNCGRVLASATNAFRIASNADIIIKKIQNDLGIEIKIIPGEEEALYSYLGVSEYLNDNETGLVIDIGGGSTEIIIGNRNDIIFKKSFSVGVVSGTEEFLKNDPPLTDEIQIFYNYLRAKFAESEKLFKIDKSFAIAGTPTTLACIQQNLKEYDEEKIEGSSLTIFEIEKLIKELSSLSSSDILLRYKAIVSGREDILLAGTIILHYLCKNLNLEEITVSTKGIRYGAIINYLNENY